MTAPTLASLIKDGSPVRIDPELTENFDSPAEMIRSTSLWLQERWLHAAIAIGTAVAIYLLLDLLRRIAQRRCQAENIGATRLILARLIARTLYSFMALLSARLVVGYASPPDWLHDLIRVAFTVVATFQGAVWLRELILALVERNADPENGSATLNNAMGIIRLLVTAVVFALALVVVLDNLGVNVTGIVAGLGIGGIAIGLAAQGIFADLFAALSILFDKPFTLGENISYDGEVGTVEHIGLKTTRLRAVTGERKIISNTQLLNKDLTNYTGLLRRRIKFAIGVIYQTRPDVARHIPELLRGIIEAEGATFVRSGFIGFGDSSLNFEVEFDVYSPNWDEVYMARHAIGLSILEKFNADGIEFAYPTQTTFTAAPDGRMIMPYLTDLGSQIAAVSHSPAQDTAQS